MSYYIKTIWGPGGDDYPSEDGIIHFSTKAKKQAQKFAESEGFLLYETSREKNGRRGNKTIYAFGEISEKQRGKELKEFNNIHSNKQFNWGVAIKILKRVNAASGIPIKVIRRAGVKQFQRWGGLIPITKKQFDFFIAELKKK